MNQFDFKFDLPVSGWEDQTVYSFKGPKVDGMDHFLLLAVDRVLSEDTLEAYVAERRNLILSTLPNIEVGRDAPLILGNRLPAHELVLKWTPAEKLIRYKRYFFAIHNDMGFTLNCDFTKQSYGLLAEEMTTIATSLLALYDTASQPPTFDR